MSKIPEVFFSVLALSLLTLAGCAGGSSNDVIVPAHKPAPHETTFEGGGWYAPDVRAFCDGSTRVYITWHEDNDGTVVTVVAKSPECEAK